MRYSLILNGLRVPVTQAFTSLIVARHFPSGLFQMALLHLTKWRECRSDGNYNYTKRSIIFTLLTIVSPPRRASFSLALIRSGHKLAWFTRLKYRSRRIKFQAWLSRKSMKNYSTICILVPVCYDITRKNITRTTLYKSKLWLNYLKTDTSSVLLREANKLHLRVKKQLINRPLIRSVFLFLSSNPSIKTYKIN